MSQLWKRRLWSWLGLAYWRYSEEMRVNIADYTRFHHWTHGNYTNYSVTTSRSGVHHEWTLVAKNLGG